MLQCPRCDFENPDTNQFCDNCGTVIQKYPGYSPSIPRIERSSMAPMEYEIPLPPPAYDGPPPPPFGLEMTSPLLFTNQKIVEASRFTVFRVIRAIFYFMAVNIAGFGLVGAFISFDNSSRNTGLGLFFWLGLIVASVVIFIRVRRRMERLRLLQWIGWLAGATVGAIMALILDYALIPGGSVNTVGSFILGCIIVVYGLALAVIALW